MYGLRSGHCLKKSYPDLKIATKPNTDEDRGLYLAVVEDDDLLLVVALGHAVVLEDIEDLIDPTRLTKENVVRDLDHVPTIKDVLHLDVPHLDVPLLSEETTVQDRAPGLGLKVLLLRKLGQAHRPLIQSLLNL